MKYFIIKFLILVVAGIFLIYLSNFQEEPAGYYVPDKASDSKLLSSIKEKYEEKIWDSKIETNSSARTVLLTLKNRPSVDTDNKISEDKAKNIAVNFLKNNIEVFGSRQIKNADENKFAEYWTITLEPITYSSLHICSIIRPLIDVSGGSVTVDFNGNVIDFGMINYPNLTAPTKQKISDEEVAKRLAEIYRERAQQLDRSIEVEPYQNSLCIFPKWHPDGEYWTYHLSKTYYVKNIDKVYYDIVGNAGILGRIEPIIE